MQVFELVQFNLIYVSVNSELSLLSAYSQAEQLQTISHKTFLTFIKRLIKILFNSSLEIR